MNRKRIISMALVAPPLLLALLYGGGYLAQFMQRYHAWQDAGGSPGSGTAPAMPSFAPKDCFSAVFTFPYGIIGVLICIGVLALC